jgi:hypothetical protein
MNKEGIIGRPKDPHKMDGPFPPPPGKYDGDESCPDPRDILYTTPKKKEDPFQHFDQRFSKKD